MNVKIGFIGVGNMGGAILKGYVSKSGKKEDILIFDADGGKMDKFREDGFYSCEGIGKLTEKSDIIIIGVKPDTFRHVLPEIAEKYTSEKVLVSMAAGIGISFIEKFAGEKAKVIRVMPNTPALVCEAVTALCANKNVTAEDARNVKLIFEQIGKVCEIPEELIHCSIGVSGSSPAYTYMYIEALVKAAVKNGMDEKQALVCAAQSVLGAAKMVLETGEDPERLRINVCSPGGTTIEAVQKLQERGFMETVEEAFQAAVDKSEKMAEILRQSD